MRKLWPFVGIALAVAGGIALAPYFWWVVVLGGIVALCVWQRRYWPFAALALMYGWPLWLAMRGQTGDAAFAAGLVTLVAFWQPIKARLRPVWLRIFPG